MINEDIGKILGIHISKGEYKSAFSRLDKMGGINPKTLMEMVIVLCQNVEDLQNELKFKDINGQEVSL
jgi:hypothetical protein